MIRGPFARMRHKHSFEAQGMHTVMKDIFNYTSPLGRLGRVVDGLFLEWYMSRLLQRRNEWIKQQAEGSSR